MPKSLSGLFSSRKALLSSIVLIMVTVLSVGITVAAVKREIAWKEAFDYLLKSLFVGASALIMNIWGIAKEDSSKNNGS